MNIDKVFSIGSAINGLDGDTWKKKIIDSFSEKVEIPMTVNLGDLALSCCGSSSEELLTDDYEYIAYGAGKMAKLYLPVLSKHIKFTEIWDSYSTIQNLYGIPVVRPRDEVENTNIIVFIDDYEVRRRVIDYLGQKGYKNVFYYRLFLCLSNEVPGLEEINGLVTEQTRSVLLELEQSYELIECDIPSALFSALPKTANRKVGENTDIALSSNEFIDSLYEVLILDEDKKDTYLETINEIINRYYNDSISLAYALELMIRNVLKDGVKTKYRKIRTFRDRPYDTFAIYEFVRLFIDSISGKEDNSKNLAESLLQLNSESVILLSIISHYCLEANDFESALTWARKAVHKDSNSLLANETLYEAAIVCKKNGIEVEEPIPTYDLSERFCWCGISFSWCGGFDKERDRAELSPCFRPLQCSARPDGEFWTSEEWKEFRRSIIDGSFRYCQKTQCPNIVAGWLPLKEKITDAKISAIVNGDVELIPTLEELHFSYDGHCNLKCPSCRTAFQTMSTEQALEFDDFYREKLQGLLYNAKHLCLSGCGEAMISPHSKKLLQSLNTKEYPLLEVELRTNMTTVTPQAWESLGEGRKVIRHIAASIDSSRKDDFERIRYPAKWDTVLNNLHFVQELRNNGELDVFEFHVVIQKDNVDQLLEIVKMAISYDADVITFSRMINWREMPENEYDEMNPFWPENPYHEQLKTEIKKVLELRDSIENGTCNLLHGKKVYINMHFEPDPNDSYDEIRYGRFRIR